MLQQEGQRLNSSCNGKRKRLDVPSFPINSKAAVDMTSIIPPQLKAVHEYCGRSTCVDPMNPSCPWVLSIECSRDTAKGFKIDTDNSAASE